MTEMCEESGRGWGELGLGKEGSQNRKNIPVGFRLKTRKTPEKESPSLFLNVTPSFPWLKASHN
jgi:hypothetical protein